MITRLKDLDFIAFLKEIGLNNFETITRHYGEINDKDLIHANTIEVVGKYKVSGAYIGYKFCGLGLCNYTNVTPFSSQLKYQLKSDDPIMTLVMNPDAMEINKALYRRLLKVQNPDIEPEDTFSKVATHYFDELLKLNAKDLDHYEKVISELRSNGYNNSIDDKKAISEAKNQLKALSTITEKVHMLKAFIQESANEESSSARQSKI